VQVAHNLLSSLDPSVTHAPEEILPVIERWRGANAKDYKGEERDGLYSQLSLKDELLCLIAALYGQTFKNGKFKTIGSPSDSDIILRCAYYGNANMTVKEMKHAHSKDDFAFVLAALKNNLFYTTKVKRVALEENLGGDNLLIYKRHCEQQHKRKEWFDSNPVSEYGKEAMQDILPKRQADLVLLDKIISQNHALKNRLDNYEKRLKWAIFIILAAIFLMTYQS